MNNKTLPVIAAIPNYNMADGLSRLLPQLITQGYDQIYVLDDCSTDNSKQIVDSFGSDVVFVKTSVNKGAGAARNLIINAHSGLALIHFLDADVSIVTPGMPQVIAHLGWSSKTSFITGLVLDSKNRQSIWNYGPKLNIINSMSGILITAFNYLERTLHIKCLIICSEIVRILTFYQRPEQYFGD
jgi:glycosyltransferase involved in cell wall biosynthesis